MRHIGDCSYARAEQWLRTALFEVLDLHDITLHAQDWGGLLSLRLVVFEPDRFARVLVTNTGLPVGGRGSNFLPDDAPRKTVAFVGARAWQAFARFTPVFPVGRLAPASTRSNLPPEVRAGYDAPFPSNAYTAAARAMPQLIPMDPDSAAPRRNREAWERLGSFDKPFRTAFSDKDATMSDPARRHVLPTPRTRRCRPAPRDHPGRRALPAGGPAHRGRHPDQRLCRREPQEPGCRDVRPRPTDGPNARPVADPQPTWQA